MTELRTEGDSGQEKKPFIVHCGDCNHEWPLFYTPFPLDQWEKFKHTACPMCCSANVLVGPPKEIKAAPLQPISDIDLLRKLIGQINQNEGQITLGAGLQAIDNLESRLQKFDELKKLTNKALEIAYQYQEKLGITLDDILAGRWPEERRAEELRLQYGRAAYEKHVSYFSVDIPRLGMHTARWEELPESVKEQWADLAQLIRRSALEECEDRIRQAKA